MSVLVTKFKCDRDNVEVDNASPYLPDGWGYVGISGGSLLPGSVNLCPACLDAFVTFMNASGGTFSLQPTAPKTPALDATAAPAAPPVASP